MLLLSSSVFVRQPQHQLETKRMNHLCLWRISSKRGFNVKTGSVGEYMHFGPFTAQSNFGPPFEQSEKLVPCFLEARAGEVIVKLNKLAAAIFFALAPFFWWGGPFFATAPFFCCGLSPAVKITLNNGSLAASKVHLTNGNGKKKLNWLMRLLMRNRPTPSLYSCKTSTHNSVDGKFELFVKFKSELRRFVFPFQRLSDYGCDDNDSAPTKLNPRKRILSIWKWELGQNGKRCNCNNWKPATPCSSFHCRRLKKRKSFNKI